MGIRRNSATLSQVRIIAKKNIRNIVWHIVQNVVALSDTVAHRQTSLILPIELKLCSRTSHTKEQRERDKGKGKEKERKRMGVYLYTGYTTFCLFV